MTEVTETTMVSASPESGYPFALEGTRAAGVLDDELTLRIYSDEYNINRHALRLALDIIERDDTL